MSKLKTLDFLVNFSKQRKKKGKKIVLCHGVFDFPHLGHVNHFNAAKKFGDYLIVSVTEDKHVSKGFDRPIYKEDQRVKFLSAFSMIDYIYIDRNSNASKVISKLRPNIYAKGQDYNLSNNAFKLGVQQRDLTGNIFKEKIAVEKIGGKIIFTNEESFSSSKNINITNMHHETIKILKKIKKKYPFYKIRKVINDISKLKILVIGDTIVDNYIYVSTLGKPSKENMMATQYDSKDIFLGGLFGAVNNLSTFCDNIDFVTVTGKEKKYENLLKKGISKNINKGLILKTVTLTTAKTRFVQQNHYTLSKLFEIYEMDDHPINKTIESKIYKFLNNNLRKYDVVIVNDYGHGLFTKKIIDILCSKSNFLAVNAQINAGNKGYNLINKYKRASYYCLTLDEARTVISDKHANINDLSRKILNLTKGKFVTVTLGGKGSISASKKKYSFTMPAFAKTTVDTMGAGDAYFAMSSPVLYLTKSIELTSLIGNIAGAIQVGITGLKYPLSKLKLLQYCNTLLKV